jgi:hypothetical protein
MAKRKATGAHKLAVAVTKREGLKKSLTVAQVKEVINCIFDELWISDLDSNLINQLMGEAKARQAKLFKKKLAEVGKEK